MSNNEIIDNNDLKPLSLEKQKFNLNDILSQLELGEEAEYYCNSYNEYIQVREEITNWLLRCINDDLLLLNNFHKDLSAVSKLKPQIENLNKKIINVARKLAGFKLKSIHIYSNDESREDFLKSRENRIIRRELEWLISHWEVPFLDKKALQNSIAIKEANDYYAELVNDIFRAVLIPKEVSVKAKLKGSKVPISHRFLQWNGLYLFSSPGLEKVFIWHPKKQEVKAYNSFDSLLVGLIDGLPIGDGTVLEANASNLSLRKLALKQNMPFSFSNIIFRILMWKKRDGVRTLDLYHLSSKGFNFDYDYYSGVERETLKDLYEFNVKSLFMGLIHLGRQGETIVDGSIPQEIRDEDLDRLPFWKKMPILKGFQGMGKGRFISIMSKFLNGGVKLGFTGAFDSQASKAAVVNNNIIEYAEIGNNSFDAVQALKAYIGSETFSYRPLYTDDNKELAISTLFIASTNEDNFLRDYTGLERFCLIPLAPRKSEREDDINNGRALFLEEFWQNKDEFINSMISLQEEYFRKLKILSKEEREGVFTKASREWKALFSYDKNCHLARLGEDLLNENNTYKNNEEIQVKDAIMSEEQFNSLSVEDKIVAMKVAKPYNLTEALNYLNNNILGTDIKPANFKSKNFSLLLARELLVVYGKTRVKTGAYAHKRTFSFKNISSKKVNGIIFLKDFESELEKPIE